MTSGPCTHITFSLQSFYTQDLPTALFSNTNSSPDFCWVPLSATIQPSRATKGEILNYITKALPAQQGSRSLFQYLRRGNKTSHLHSRDRFKKKEKKSQSHRKLQQGWVLSVDLAPFIHLETVGGIAQTPRGVRLYPKANWQQSGEQKHPSIIFCAAEEIVAWRVAGPSSAG